MAGAGDLDRRIRVEQAQEVRDAQSGQLKQTWIPLFETWAQRRAPAPSESFQAGQVLAKVRTPFRIRYRGGLNPGSKLRVVDLSDAGRVYDIQGASEPLERRRYIELLCEARGE